MHENNGRKRHASGDAGFTLFELLITVGIIAVMAAVSLPAIGRYFRNYQIRNAAREVAAEIQTARTKAIMKNVTWGVLFVTLSPTTYRYIIEDDPANPAAPTLNILGPIRTLPGDVRFSNVGVTDSSVRFDRMGAACDPGSNTALCPNVTVGANFVRYVTGSDITANTGWFIDLTQTSTGLTQTVRILTGGRVLVPRG
jgi:prepilin-type N-terminal cleavage/methylation domain-containing protein